jgi:hypothetical protein
MKAVAISRGRAKRKAQVSRKVGTLRCEGYCEEFFIYPHPAFVDTWLADKRAHWLERVWRKSRSAKRNTWTESRKGTHDVEKGR